MENLGVFLANLIQNVKGLTGYPWQCLCPRDNEMASTWPLTMKSHFIIIIIIIYLPPYTTTISHHLLPNLLSTIHHRRPSIFKPFFSLCSIVTEMLQILETKGTMKSVDACFISYCGDNKLNYKYPEHDTNVLSKNKNKDTGKWIRRIFFMWLSLQKNVFSIISMYERKGTLKIIRYFNIHIFIYRFSVFPRYIWSCRQPPISTMWEMPASHFDITSLWHCIEHLVGDH